MKKVLIIIFSVIVILCLAGIFAWNMLPTIISHKLSKTAGVTVSIEDIKLSSSSIEVDTIHVDNPKGYHKTKRALSVDTLTADIPFSHFFDNKLVINAMTLDDVYIGLEFDSPKNPQGNWTAIMNHMSASTTEEQKKAKEADKTTSVLIKTLVITDLKIELAYKTGNKANHKLRTLDRIVLHNINSEGGIPTNQIMNIVLQETLRNIFSQEGLQNMLEGILNPNQSENNVLETLKGLFSELIILDNNWEDFERNNAMPLEVE